MIINDKSDINIPSIFGQTFILNYRHPSVLSLPILSSFSFISSHFPLHSIIPFHCIPSLIFFLLTSTSPLLVIHCHINQRTQPIQLCFFLSSCNEITSWFFDPCKTFLITIITLSSNLFYCTEKKQQNSVLQYM